MIYQAWLTHFLIGDKFLESININPLEIACIKIDVEGFEYKVIKGLERTLSLTNAIMIIEINPVTIKKAGITFNYLKNKLMSYGFNSSRLSPFIILFLKLVFICKN